MSNVRVSNTALYTSALTPPETFTQTSNTTFLLWNGFKEKIGNTTFTQTGTVTYSDENASRFPYLML